MGFLADLTAAGITLFVIGLVFCAIEMASPGFGIFGIVGIGCYTASVAVTVTDWVGALEMGAAIFAVTAVMGLIFMILASKGVLPSKLVLKQDVRDPSSPQPDPSGSRGVTLTELRPSGAVEIDGKRFDAVSEGGFIEAGTEVIVASRRLSGVVVRRADAKDQSNK